MMVDYYTFIYNT